MGKSLDYIKECIKKGIPIGGITYNNLGNLHQTTSEIKNAFNSTFQKVWEEDGIGITLQQKDLDTQEYKDITIKYNPSAEFDSYYVKSGICSKNEKYLISLMGQTLSEIMYANVDDYSKMPKGYIQQEGEEISDTYFDYNVEYTIGDFVTYREEHWIYRFMESMEKLEDDNSTKDEMNNRIVVIIPFTMKYIPKDRKYEEE